MIPSKRCNDAGGSGGLTQKLVRICNPGSKMRIKIKFYTPASITPVKVEMCPSSEYGSSSYNSRSASSSTAPQSQGDYYNNRDYSDSGYGNKRSYDSQNSYGGRPSRSGELGSGRFGSGNAPSVPPCTEEFRKNFLPSNLPCKLDDRETNEFRRSAEMSVKGKSIPPPFTEFSHCPFPERILAQFKKNSFARPTPIQSQGWSIALAGHDVVGIAQTGSGKTLSYMIPALIHVMDQRPIARGEGPIALVLAPTRELAVQIEQVAKEYGTLMKARSTCLFGGVPKGPQCRDLSYGVEIVIATPGRLIDLVESGRTNLARCSFLVLDEADRMLDMGFEQDIRKIIALTRPDRQTLMWSATWPREVQGLARDFLGEFIQINIGSDELTANKKITQNISIVDHREKESKLADLLFNIWDSLEGDERDRRMPKIIIFANTKRVCDNLCHKMKKDNWPCEAIHGDKSQTERDLCLHHFKTGDCPILIATDVAARGLDVKDVKIVVNYDIPKNIEDYVHRIGRTARGSSKEGQAYTFVTDEDAGVVKSLIEILKDAKQEVPPALYDLMPRGRYGGGGGGGQRRWGGSRGGSGGGGNPNNAYYGSSKKSGGGNTSSSNYRYNAGYQNSSGYGAGGGGW